MTNKPGRVRVLMMPYQDGDDGDPVGYAGPATVLTGLPRTIRWHELRLIVPLADSTIYEMKKRGDFPRRYNLTPRWRGVAQLAAVDVDVADLVGLEPLALLLGLFDRQSGDAVTLEATMQGATAEVGDGVSQAANTSSSGSSVFCRNATTMASSAGVNTVLLGALGPIGASAVWSATAPFLHRLRVQTVSSGKGPGALLRRLELGSNTRRRAGAAVKKASQSASSS